MSAFIGIPVLMLILLISGLFGCSEDTSVPGPTVQYDEYGMCSVNGGYTPVDCSTGLPN